jgi:exopolysaccharide biosynthesis polyprenyl glycosylphosphotransferase
MGATSVIPFPEESESVTNSRRLWGPRGEQFEILFNTLLVPVDFLCVLGAFLAAYAVQMAPPPTTSSTGGFGDFFIVFLLLAPLWLAMFAVVGAYNQAGFRSRWDETGKVVVAVSGAGMLLMVVDAFPEQALFPTRELPVYGFALSLLFVLLGRQLLHTAQRALYGRDLGVRRTVIIGSGPVAQRLVRSLSHTRRSGYRVVGLIDASGSTAREAGQSNLPVYRNLSAAEAALGGQFDEFIQADSSLAHDDVLEIMRFASENDVSYRLVPNHFGLYAADAAVGTLGGLPVVKLRQTPLEGWGRVFKRSFDVVAAAVGLLVLSPVLAGVALLIAVFDPGPVIFRQERLARAGRPFHILKFRTMQTRYSGQPPLEVFRELGREDLIAEFLVDQKVKDDPRVSGLGAFLRRTSLDELPQLWNVLAGELSLVGPRPIVREELAKFGGSKDTILALKPGITGLWQISGRSDLDYDERVRLNIQYVANWSPRLDLAILVRTLRLVVSGGGAY